MNPYAQKLTDEEIEVCMCFHLFCACSVCWRIWFVQAGFIITQFFVLLHETETNLCEALHIVAVCVSAGKMVKILYMQCNMLVVFIIL